uniref:Putative trk system potassium uptake protein TrkA-like protein (TrkA) n=1 Tax=uncultured marine group II/III euryarchaeote AD1000_66_E09 TaxID=1457798 RepID=A0A075FUZ0_9EURY|nr:putative trk system potassium uptake protein TrkA-like protein (trkA) [uncultured marine group II/III euryarchaeote AD1000_66_E09]
MYIVIVGAGKVGAEAARELVASGHEITVIDRRVNRVNDLNEELGEIAVLGDGTEVRVQSEAGMNRADLVVAATGRDEVNLAVSQVAKHRFGTSRSIARVNYPRNAEIFRILGVDTTVSATQAILSHIEQELPSHPVIHLLELHASDYELVEVMVPDDAPTIGYEVQALNLPPDSLLSLVVHPDGRPEIPCADSIIEAGAAVMAVTLPQHEAALRRALTGVG